MGTVVSIDSGRKKTKPQPLVLSKAETEAAEVDEYGRLHAWLDVHKRIKARHDKLGAAIAGRYAKEPGMSTFTAEGVEYVAEVSARANKRTVTKIKVLKKLLGEKFLALCKINLEDIDANVPASEHPKFLHEELSGNRTVKAFAKAVLGVEKAA